MLNNIFRLSVALLLLAALAVPAAAGGFEAELLVLINGYRTAKGLKALTGSALYDDLAREHSRAMQEQQSLSHDGFDERFQRAAADGARSCVENVAWNYETPQSLLDGWRKSAGHNRNMLQRKIRRAGIGRSGQYVTFFACY